MIVKLCGCVLYKSFEKPDFYFYQCYIVIYMFSLNGFYVLGFVDNKMMYLMGLVGWGF